MSEVTADPAIRPRSFEEYIGQSRAKGMLSLFVQAARERNENLDHLLLSGPPGLGKTTLAHIVATEMKSSVHLLAGPNVEKKGDLAAILTNLAPHDVLFIDEIHRLPRAVEEILYSAMEDFKFDLVVGQGPAARTMRLDLPRFTLVGATTRAGLLSSPLRDRFGVQLRLEFYPAEDLAQIVLRSARILGIPFSEEGALEIGRRSRGTPRIANRLLRRVRDVAQVRSKGSPTISVQVVRDGLAALEVDARGLDVMDRKYLELLIHRFQGGPVGLESLASALSEDAGTLEDMYEPFLVQEGFVQRTPRGRTALPPAYQHLGVSQKPAAEVHPGGPA